MMNEFGLTQDIVAQRVGCERSSVANAVRLLQLPIEVQHLIETDQLSAGHAKVILGLASPAGTTPRGASRRQPSSLSP